MGWTCFSCSQEEGTHAHNFRPSYRDYFSTYNKTSLCCSGRSCYWACWCRRTPMQRWRWPICSLLLYLHSFYFSSSFSSWVTTINSKSAAESSYCCNSSPSLRTTTPKTPLTTSCSSSFMSSQWSLDFGLVERRQPPFPSLDCYCLFYWKFVWITIFNR